MSLKWLKTHKNKVTWKQMAVMHKKAGSPVDVYVHRVFERKRKADGVVMEILLHLIVIAEGTKRCHTAQH